MKRITIAIILAVNSCFLFGQVSLITEGTNVNNTQTGSWDGVNIQRSSVTNLIYRNNVITSVNSSGYMLQAGDEGEGSTNNHLNGEIITGNKMVWNGTDLTSITHGIFTGYNRDAVVKYNYLDRVPMAIIRKSNGMTDASGAVAYNIIKNPNVGMVIKGMNGIKIYNNTFYSTKSTSETSRSLVEIYANDSFSPAIPSTGNIIKNNIFYTKYQITNIDISESADLKGFESDYNVFYCESGAPQFKYLGSVKTFAQWQALGYDTHSVVINPNFNNATDLVPATRMNYGTNVGATWQTGLSASAVWTLGVSPATAVQDATWQVGARVLTTSTTANPNNADSTATNSLTAPVKDETVSVKMTVVPNHVHKTVNILFEYVGTVTAITSALTPETLRIFDLTGKLMLEKVLVTGVTTLKLPVNYKSGIYSVELYGNEFLMASQKMIVY